MEIDSTNTNVPSSINTAPLEHVRGTISIVAAAPSSVGDSKTSSGTGDSNESTVDGTVNAKEPIVPRNSLETLRIKYARDTSRLRILEVIHHTAVKNGDPEAIPSVPWLGGSPIDISHLFMLVISRGGFDKMESSQQWGEIVKLLGFDCSQEVTAIDTIRATYQRTLFTFERQMQAKKNNPSEKRSRPDHSGDAASASASSSKSVAGGNTSTQVAGLNGPSDSSSSEAAASCTQSASSNNPTKKARMSTGAVKVTSFDSKPPPTPAAPPAPVVDKIKEFVYPITKKRNDKEIILEAIQELSSKNMSDVVKGLNSIAVRSAEADNRSLAIENYPNILIALGELMDLVNPYPAKYFANILERDKDGNAAISLAAPGTEEELFADWNYVSDVRCCEVSPFIF